MAPKYDVYVVNVQYQGKNFCQEKTLHVRIELAKSGEQLGRRV